MSSLLKAVRHGKVRRARPAARKRADRKPRLHRERVLTHGRLACPDCGHRPDHNGLCRCARDVLCVGV